MAEAESQPVFSYLRQSLAFPFGGSITLHFASRYKCQLTLNSRPSSRGKVLNGLGPRRDGKCLSPSYRNPIVLFRIIIYGCLMLGRSVCPRTCMRIIQIKVITYYDILLVRFWLSSERLCFVLRLLSQFCRCTLFVEHKRQEGKKSRNSRLSRCVFNGTIQRVKAREMQRAQGYVKLAFLEFN